MHFVHIEDFFHPDAGYQLNTLAPLQARQGHHITIVTAELEKIPAYLTSFFGRDGVEEKDEAFFERTGVRVVRHPLHRFVSGRAIFKKGLFEKVEALRPDVAFIHGEDTLTGIQFIKRSAKLPYPLVLDCHMLEMASVNRFRAAFRAYYRTFVTPIILKHKIPLIRVVDSDFVEKCLGIPLERTALLSFGTDTEHFTPDPQARVTMRKQLGLSQDSFVVIYAGKLDPSKGGQLLADALMAPFQLDNGRQIEFLVVGSGSGAYVNAVEATFQNSANTIMRAPTQKYPDLNGFYQCADLAVFPRQCSMSFFEVQSCGVPAVFEENEINSLRVAGQNARTFTAENTDSIRKAIIHYANMDKEQAAICSRDSRNFIVEQYDYVKIAQQFSDIMLGEIHRFAKGGKR